jgi:hypothetical protein
MRDLDRLRRMAAGHGEAIGVYATALLDIPLQWTKMRQVYALLGSSRSGAQSESKPPAGGRLRPKRSTSA